MFRDSGTARVEQKSPSVTPFTAKHGACWFPLWWPCALLAEHLWRSIPAIAAVNTFTGSVMLGHDPR
jgi:hypothetical protein